MPDVYSTSFDCLLLNYVLKFNTSWDTAVEMSAERYLVVGYSLASILNFLEFLFVGQLCVKYATENCEATS